MLRAIIWRDLRWRLLAAIALVAPIAGLLAWSYAVERPAGMGYPDYLDAAWFHLPGPSAVLLVAAVIVAAGSSVLQPRNDLAYVLALPITRRSWVLAHVGLSIAALAVVIVVIDVIFAIGAWRADMPLSPGRLVVRSLAVLVAASAWVGVTVGVLAAVRRPVIAMVVVLGVIVALPTSRFQLQLPLRPPAAPLASWDPWAFADPRSWNEGVPFSSLVVAIALGVAGVMLALNRLERFEP